jgi:thiamine-monophosphate kinase
LGATAMIDVSDGLSADLDRLATASGVGLRLGGVPVHPAATPEEAFGGGDDYALAFCAPEAADVEGAFAGLDTPIRIGRCTADPAERALAGEPFTPAGWEHEWAPWPTPPGGEPG